MNHAKQEVAMTETTQQTELQPSTWFRRIVTGGSLTRLAAALLLIGHCGTVLAAERQLRGIWMHANFIRTPAEADACVEKLQRANFNAVFLLVWYWGGQAAFQSQFCPMLEGVQPGHDPMGYMIKECHRRQIEVHAWFVNGAHGHPRPLHVLDKHPDWAVDTGGGTDEPWYDFGKPEVRKFQSDLMIEALTRYDLDGIHFDFIRYDGPTVCYCRHCQTEFAARYGCGSFQPSRRASFPFVGTISGNPVAGPTTAKVLAKFSDGTPAIATNALGKGKVLLFNWHALRTPCPPAVETLSRALQQWNVSRDKVFVVDTAPNRESYGGRGATEAAAALRKLGCDVTIAAEDRLNQLPSGSLVVLSDVYLIPDGVAESLERFVRDGGLLVVIDGLSIRNASIQRVLGMSLTAKYMNRLDAVLPACPSDLLVCEDIKNLEQIKRRQAKWPEYRKAGVTELVRDVFQRAKRAKPGAQVTAAVFTPLASAEQVFQDWPRWIREGIVDYAIPMAYTPKNDVLAKQLEEWLTVDPRMERILPGLGIFTEVKGSGCYAPREIGAILAQHRMCMDKGARGTCFYSLDGTAANPVLLLTEPLIETLRNGLFKNSVPAYRPAARVAPN